MTDQPELPFELTARSIVNLGPAYGTIISLGKKGASDVIHLTPLGHATLTERLREAVEIDEPPC